MDRHKAMRVAAVAFSTGMIVALATTSAASASPRIDTPDPAPAGLDAASPDMLQAMQRGFDITAEEARARMAKEDVAARTTAKLDNQLGTSFGGAWLTDDQQLVVAITDPAEIDRVRALGATPEIVNRSASQLDALKTKLDRAATPDADEITGWRVEVTSNTVIVQAKPGAEAAAEDFLAASGVDTDAVRVEVSDESPRLLYDVRGGDAYYPGSSRCSVGFSVNGGFVTAGHCGGTDTRTSGYNQVSQGTVQGSSFPGNDYGWVAVNSNWTPTPLVNRYSGNQTVTVAGSQEAPVNSSVCRSGSTTGWECGTITAKNQTVNYPQGTVYGLTRTTACAEGGDSGGSWLTGQQAQGVTSGGSGNCSTGGTTYFQPVNEILSAYNRTLVTGGGGNPPPPPPDGCESSEYNYQGSLSGTGDYDFQPNGSYFYWPSSGTHEGCLSGPGNADFDLYLQRYGSSGWQTVASSLSADSEESLTYNGGAGYYRYVVNSYSGSGGYDMGIDVP